MTPRPYADLPAARAVATFSGGVESRNAPARIAPATPCSSLGVERPDAQPEPPRAQSRSSARPAALFNGRNAGVDRIGERGAVGDGSHAVGALKIRAETLLEAFRMRGGA